METHVIKQEEPVIRLTNNELQNVQALLSPNLMFLNKPVMVNQKMYYKLVVWFDYYELNDHELKIYQDIVFDNLEFQFYVKNNNELIALKDNQEKIERFDIRFHHIPFRYYDYPNSKKDYFNYLIDAKYVDSFDELNLVYNLQFSSSNYPEFMPNGSGAGQNRGAIKIQTSSKLNDQEVVVPEVMVYVHNDIYGGNQEISQVILTKKYRLYNYPVNYVNVGHKAILKIEVNKEKVDMLEIFFQSYLAEIIYDFEQNFVVDDVLIEEVKMGANQEIKEFYQEKLEYSLLKNPFDFELKLTSLWTFNPDLKKVIKTSRDKLIFNPLIVGDQWIEIKLKLSNKPFLHQVFINRNKFLTISDQARDLKYLKKNVYHFKIDDLLTYRNYLEARNEN